MQDIRNGKTGDFRDSKDYDLVYEGKRYPPKMVVGLAAQYLPRWGRALSSHDFHGGTRSSFIKKLSELGFKIVAKGDWTPGQNRAAIRAYSRMLRSEWEGRRYIKKDNIRHVVTVTMRAPKAIEYKFQNISAVLRKLDYGWLNGYRPKANYQHTLEAEVKALLLRDERLRNFLRSLRSTKARSLSRQRNSRARSLANLLLEEPPSFSITKKKRGRPRVDIRPRKDYERLAKEQRRLGEQGELLVLDFLKKLVKRKFGSKLEKKVIHTSKIVGDHAGYDIEAFDEHGSRIYVEVKTTKGGKKTPFVISRTQLAVAEINKKEYWVYRVYDWGSNPRIYRLKLTGHTSPPMRPETFIVGLSQ